MEPEIEPVKTEESQQATPQPEQMVPATNLEPEKISKLKKFKQKFSKKQLIIFGIVFVILLAAGVVAYVMTRPSPPKNKGQSEQTGNTNEQGLGTPAALPENQLPDNQPIDGNTYYDVPKKLADQKLFANMSYFGGTCDDNGQNCKPDSPSIVSYYEVGTTKDGRKILVLLVPGGIDGSQFFALSKKSGGFEILARMDSSLESLLKKPEQAESLATFKKGLNQSVTLNDTTQLAELFFAADLEVGGQKIKHDDYDHAEMLENGLSDLTKTTVPNQKKTLVKISTLANITFYRVVSTSSETDTYQIVSIVGVIGSFRVQYDLNGELTKRDEQINNTKWQSGENNTSKYFTGGPGCGFLRTYVITNNVSKDQLTQVGTSAGGQKLYQLPVTHPLAKELFDKDYSKGENLDDASLKNLTIQQFSDKHGYFIVEDGFNELVVMQRDDLFMRGGCAKPVIYLYPTRPSLVNVAVGADVTKSDPLYPTGGWQNVLAQPSGLLTYGNKDYPSLFWEGYGHGSYPEITTGTIVPSSQAAAKIHNQLLAQGLNEQEIKDFLDFWTPKLPTTPYTRITWLGNKELDGLAPLQITPRPSTEIRVFLDFEGLQQPYDLPAQHLHKPARNGFTVVEWGGLARDGSVPKLR